MIIMLYPYTTGVLLTEHGEAPGIARGILWKKYFVQYLVINISIICVSLALLCCSRFYS